MDELLACLDWVDNVSQRLNRPLTTIEAIIIVHEFNKSGMPGNPQNLADTLNAVAARRTALGKSMNFM